MTIRIAPAVSSAARGDVSNSTFLREVSTDELAAIRKAFGLTSPQLPPITNPVRLYRVSYATVGLHGEPMVASGLVIVPKGAADGAPLLSYQHGTVAGRTAGPSLNQTDRQYQLVMALFGGAGYVCSLPDYLGYGVSAEAHPEKWADPKLVDVPGANQQRYIHPYLNALTEATASADMLRAAAQVSRTAGVQPSKRVFLTGYSQGGHATMALHRYLENTPSYASQFKVAASVPMAGPHDLVGTVERIAKQPNKLFGAATFAYGIMAQDNMDRLWPKVSDFLAQPFAALAWQNFSSDPPPSSEPYAWTKGFVGIQPRAMLTAKADGELFDGERLRRNTRFAIGLRHNNTYRGWKSDAPILVVNGSTDDTVPWDINANTVVDHMKTHGFTHVSLLTLPGLDHATAVIPAFSGAAAFMEHYRAAPAPIRTTVPRVPAKAA